MMGDMCAAEHSVDKVKEPHLETPAEEAVSSITHGIGAMLSIAGLIALIGIARLGSSPRGVVVVSIYGVTLLLMYVASTGYHLARSPRAKRAMKIFDHASIYLLIAGTYTPILLLAMRGAGDGACLV